MGASRNPIFFHETAVKARRVTVFWGDMTLWQAVLYGAVQGITEYLPISSSAHLILLPRFLGIQEPGIAFDVFLHLGTLFATLIYFRREWWALATTLPWVGPKLPPAPLDVETLSWRWVAIGTLPALMVGALGHRWIETVLRGNGVLVFTLAFGGILLWASDAFAKKERPLPTIGLREALGVGLFQCLALVPGMSRSGSTILGGRLLGLSRGAAAKFSFLLSAPVTAAALLFKLKDLRQLAEEQIGLLPLVVAGFASFAFGWLAISALLSLVRRFGFSGYAIYRVLLAIVIFKWLGV